MEEFDLDTNHYPTPVPNIFRPHYEILFWHQSSV